MTHGLRLNSLSRWPLPLAIALAALLPAAAGAAESPPKSAGPLSPVLAELARPAVAAEPPAIQAEALGVARSGPASLVREGDRVLVTARFDDGAMAALAALRAAGARVVSADRGLQTVTLSAAPADLPALASVGGVESIWEQRQPIVYAVNCEGGSAISEGLGQLRVDEAQSAFQLRGKGLTVGVLSDSFDAATKPVTRAADDVLSGDLPGAANTCPDQQLPVAVLAEGSGSDEGRAMLQTVHDLAPLARLAFATAFESEESFAQNIERLARPGTSGGADADVIVDDVAWFEEPFFQDGPIAAAIERVAAEGVSYFSAAGNDNLFDSSGREISSWEAPAFRDSGACPAAVAGIASLNGSHCADFDPGPETDPTFWLTVDPGRTLTLDLQWAEPWNAVATDLDAFLLAEDGSILVKAVKDNVKTQRPVEILQWKNTAASPKKVSLAINRFAGLSPRLKFILLENGSGVSATEYPQSGGGDVVGPSISGHAGAAAAITVGAVPYSNSSVVEPYSSRGPVTHYFGPVKGAIPALPLGAAEVVPKPDLAATDCGATTFFPAGTRRFCGTSAAAPHTGAVAALVREGGPALSNQQVRQLLAETAAPVGSYPPQAAGAGLVDAFRALGHLPLPIRGAEGPSTPAPAGEAPAGGTSGPSAPAAVAVRPQTVIRRHPPKVVRTRSTRARAVFRFGSDQAGVSFLCRIDRKPFRACRRRVARFFGLGPHAVRAKAVGSTGLADATPAVFRFRVERVA